MFALRNVGNVFVASLGTLIGLMPARRTSRFNEGSTADGIRVQCGGLLRLVTKLACSLA